MMNKKITKMGACITYGIITLAVIVACQDSYAGGQFFINVSNTSKIWTLKEQGDEGVKVVPGASLDFEAGPNIGPASDTLEVTAGGHQGHTMIITSTDQPCGHRDAHNFNVWWDGHETTVCGGDVMSGQDQVNVPLTTDSIGVSGKGDPFTVTWGLTG